MTGERPNKSKVVDFLSKKLFGEIKFKFQTFHICRNISQTAPKKQEKLTIKTDWSFHFLMKAKIASTAEHKS